MYFNVVYAMDLKKNVLLIDNSISMYFIVIYVYAMKLMQNNITDRQLDMHIP